MKTKKRLDGIAYGSMFLIALVVFIAADDARAQSMGDRRQSGYSRYGNASSGSFDSMQNMEMRQTRQNSYQDNSQLAQENRQLEQNINPDPELMEAENRRIQQNIDQAQQQAGGEYISDYDEYGVSGE